MRPFLAALMVLATPAAYAQTTDVSPSFEVASVRRSEVRDGGRFGMLPGGRFVMVNGTLQSLISFAYNLRLSELIIGAPEWVRSETYDVNAKAADPEASVDLRRLMVRALLRERFNLHITQTHEVRPVYELVLDRADGRLGPKLQKAAIDCDAIRREIAAGKPPLRPPSLPRGVEPCMTLGRPTSMASGGTTMAALASGLIGLVNRPVTDKTGLQGFYTYELEFEPAETDNATSTLPSIFTTLREQLGLRLDSSRATVEVLVINRIERPTVE